MENYIIQESSQEEIEYIDGKLDEYNESKVPYTQKTWAIDVNRTLKDQEGNLIGAIKAYLYGWKCLFIEYFWVKEDYRKKGLGTILLEEVERVGKGYGSHLAHVDTFDFQAKDFYIKNGYTVFGILDDCPVGHKRYFLKKIL